MLNQLPEPGHGQKGNQNLTFKVELVLQFGDDLVEHPIKGHAGVLSVASQGRVHPTYETVVLPGDLDSTEGLLHGYNRRALSFPHI